MGKEKTQEHSLETEARGALGMVLSDWVINPHDQDDYGVDFSVRPVKEQEQLPTEIDIQLKASESYDGESDVVQRIDTDALEDYMRSRKPVFLMVYEQVSGEIYWTLIQEYIWEEYGRDPESWRNQSTVTIRLDRTPLSDSRETLIEVAENAEKPIYEYVLEESVMDFMLGRASRSEVRRALQSGESESIAFKEDSFTADIAEPAAGMANASGGFLILGVEERTYDGRRAVTGVEDPEGAISRVKRRLENVQPPIDAEISVESVDGTTVVVVEIPVWSALPHAIDGTFYIREGVTNRPMGPDELADYFI